VVSTSQIGNSHRVALRRDSYYQLVAGAFDIDAERGRKYGESQGIHDYLNIKYIIW